MTKSQLGRLTSLLGSLLAAGALAMAGCGGGSSGGGTGGKTGTGGKGSGGGPGTGGKLGTGGAGATDAGGDVRPGTGGSTDAGGDARDATPVDTGPCVTAVGADNRLLFPFDNGANAGWIAEVTRVGYMFGSSRTDGDRCPGAISLTVSFSSFGDPAADVAYKYSPAGDWTGFSKLHASVKIVTSNYAAVNGVQPFFQTNNYGSYSNGGFASASTFSDGRFHEIVLDMLHPGFTSGTVMFNSITQFGIQILVPGAATDGGPAAPGDVQMLVDDVWLEPTPPAVDAGTDTPPDAPVDTGVDVPPADTGVDVPAVDTGASDSAPADATAG